MISGATRGAGGAALGRHLANADHNEAVRMGPSRGLIADTVKGQVAELTDLGSHARTRTPLYHVHLDPPPGAEWSEAQRAAFWRSFEAEFALEDRPYASQIHVKNGRTHEHREYLRIRADGSAIRLDHDFARREKLSRVAEFEAGLRFVPGKFNRSVIAALDRERPDVAEAMRAAGLADAPRPVAPVTPKERAQQERTEITKADIEATAWSAWTASDSGRALEGALAADGLRLAQGDKGVVVVDRTGNAHSLARLVGAASKRTTGSRVRAGDVTARLAGLSLSTLADGPTTRGQQHDTTSPIEALTTPPRGAATPTAAPFVDGSGPQGDHRRHLDRGSRAAGPARTPGPDGGGADGSGAGGQAAAPARPVTATPGGGVADQCPARPGRDDGRRAGPGRTEAGRRHVATRRTERGLAQAVGARADRLAALTEALTPVRDRALRLIFAEEHRLARDATGPWPDAAERDSYAVMHRCADAVRAEQAQRRAAMEDAHAAVRGFDRLAAWFGFTTPAVRRADRLYDEWAAAERTLADDVAAAERSGLAAAHRRQDERNAWQQRHDHDRQRVGLARRAVEAGREDVIHQIAEGDLDRAADRLVVEERSCVQELARARTEAVARREAQRRAAAAAEASTTTPTPGPRLG